MRSSTGAHYIALDHVRALAAFMVFTWHFTHGSNGYPVLYNDAPLLFPLSLLDEGHTGVALFMTLSGYLFAKLLDGKTIHYGSFLWNRCLRLLPLLFLVIVIVGIREFIALQKFSGEDVIAYSIFIAKGAVLPTLPNGGWSITAEFHFYLVLPLFLWMLRRSKFLPFSIVIAAIMLRVALYSIYGQVQSFAFLTIIGRIDQFALGMILYQFRSSIAGRHIIAVATMTAFTLFYWYFDWHGGFYNYPFYPSPYRFWIFIPTIEGLAYAVCIAWYDSSFSPSTTGVSRFIGRIGEYSYSIYLLHFFVVLYAARFVQERVMDISGFYPACMWAMVFFLLMMPVSYLSYRFIESPFLKLRKRYIIAQQVSE